MQTSGDARSVQCPKCRREIVHPALYGGCSFQAQWECPHCGALLVTTDVRMAVSVREVAQQELTPTGSNA